MPRNACRRTDVEPAGIPLRRAPGTGAEGEPDSEPDGPELGLPEDGVPEDGVPEDGVPEDGEPEVPEPEPEVDGEPEDEEELGGTDGRRLFESILGSLVT